MDYSPTYQITTGTGFVTTGTGFVTTGAALVVIRGH